MLAARFLERFVAVGRLTVVDASGKVHVFAGRDGPAVTIRLHDRSLHWRLFLRPELYTGEAYMHGTLTIDDGDLYGFLEFVGRNMQAAGGRSFDRVVSRADRLFRYLQQFNPMPRARRNAAHHYDLTGRFFELFLDGDRQYSCAYFKTPHDDLETAQEQKKRHIAAKLLLEPGMRVLDIGSGWGGLGLFLARTLEVDVTGIALAREQVAASQARAQREGLSDRVRFELLDYRQVTGRFDRIVSVGMFEHVGVAHHRDFFAAVRRLLSDRGIALLHTIGRAEPPGSTNPWLRKYIFPGGYSPALSEIVKAVEKSDLWITDVEVLRLHYAETLRLWRERFESSRDEVAALFDERFCRMWEFYLAGCEVAFRYDRSVVFQIQLAKDSGAAPLTRDYMVEEEKALTRADAGGSHRAA